MLHVCNRSLKLTSVENVGAPPELEMSEPIASKFVCFSWKFVSHFVDTSISHISFRLKIAYVLEISPLKKYLVEKTNFYLFFKSL